MHTGVKLKHSKVTNNVSFIENDKNWKKLDNGDWVYKCVDTCFPKNIKSKNPCSPRCLYTNSGYGEPMNINIFFKKKKPPNTPQKTVYISYGPPGSGKGSVLEYIDKHLKVPKHTVIEVNVDSVIQDKKHTVGQQFEKYKNQIETNISASNKSLKIKKKLTGRLYNYYRWVADQISDMILQKAMLSNYNILWETTGSSGIPYINEWIKDKQTKGYTVKIIYPYVELETLKQRVKTRAEETGQIAASDEKITTMYNNAVNNLNKFKIDKKDIIIIDNNNNPRNFGSKIIKTEYFINKHNQSKKLPTKTVNKEVSKQSIVDTYGLSNYSL